MRRIRCVSSLSGGVFGDWFCPASWVVEVSGYRVQSVPVVQVMITQSSQPSCRTCRERLSRLSWSSTDPEFLVHLQRLLVVWDGSPIHRRVLVREFVSGTHGKVRLELFPGYAPDLNPWDEGGWNHLKNVEMRNLVCKDLEELHEQFQLAVNRLRQKAWLVHSFFDQAGLSL